MVLGAQDIALVTLTELAQIAAQACGASAIPLLVDADHGYGNALNGACTVKGQFKKSSEGLFTFPRNG
ncbi:carboxyvinyl-carboxyphosphonate phosphorylmutase [Caballeronia udeis]|uniref:Carboxyvinyl-carboxyphosphonate phosphorylmutase n=2 Tax=Caballeronia udeis TaxID=1232866 RepID=A0A158K2Z7_9BURK|nr:carboxyvinyl-carboxyphosphonate phosphorylmutase [Caballeronia udeis]